MQNGQGIVSSICTLDTWQQTRRKRSTPATMVLRQTVFSFRPFGSPDGGQCEQGRYSILPKITCYKLWKTYIGYRFGKQMKRLKHYNDLRFGWSKARIPHFWCPLPMVIGRNVRIWNPCPSNATLQCRKLLVQTPRSVRVIPQARLLEGLSAELKGLNM